MEEGALASEPLGFLGYGVTSQNREGVDEWGRGEGEGPFVYVNIIITSLTKILTVMGT